MTLSESAAAELDRRDIDRDPDVVRPAGSLGAGLVQHPFAESLIMPVSSATGMNSAGEIMPRSG